MKLLTGIETRVLNVGTLISSGLLRPMRPDHLVRIGRLYRAWGPTPALGYLAASFAPPRRHRPDRRARGAHVRGGEPAHERARARAGRRRHRRGRSRRRHVPQPPRLRRRHRGAVQARRPLPVPQHLVRRAADQRRGQARGRQRDRLRPGVHRPRGRRGRGPQDLRGLGGGRRRRRRDRDRRLARAPDPPRRPVRPGAAGRAGAHGDPHLGDHRHAEGRDAPVADLASSRRRRCSRRSRCTRARSR